VTGPISGGLTVLDFDSGKAYRWWKQTYPEWADKLPTSKSGRGYHVLFRSTLTKDDTTSYCQMHIKARGLVSLPPSVHENGARYVWLKPLPENIDQLPLLDPHEWNLGEFTDGKDGIDGSEGNDGSEGVGKGGVRLRFGDFAPQTQVAITDAIEQTRPKRHGERYRLIFLFCRILKKTDELKDKSAEELMEVADMWHESARPNINTQSLTMTRIRFADAWEDAKYPSGEGKSLDMAWENAQNSTVPMPELQDYKDEPLIQKVIRLCFALQELAGPDDEWFLPTNKGPKLFHVSHSWLATLLNHLETRKIIKKTRKHTQSRCTRYRYTGPSAQILRKQTA
jgi:hypothetical protein